MKKLTQIILMFAIAIATSVAGSVPPTEAATRFLVNNTQDAPDSNLGDGICQAAIASSQRCTLRAALMEAQALAGRYTVDIPAGIYNLSIPGGIDVERDGSTGDLYALNVDVRGSKTGQTIIQGGPGWAGRIMEVDDSSLSNLIIRGGNLTACNGGAGLYILGKGSGSANIALTNVTVAQNTYHVPAQCNSGSHDGGGILVGFQDQSTLTLTNSTVANNTIIGNTFSDGGGIFIDNGNLNLINSTLTGNVTTGGGGGLAILGENVFASLTGSTISNNAAKRGGGIGVGLILDFDQSLLTMTNSTISGNSSTQSGGGLYVDNNSEVYLANVTIANNTAGSAGPSLVNGLGGGIFNQRDAPITIKNSILADNRQLSLNPQTDCSGSLISQGYNLIESHTGCTISGNGIGNKIGLDPALGPLQDNGGPTFTQMSNYGPGMDAGDPSGCVDIYTGTPLTVDQRGIGRNQGAAGGPGRCDMGATEIVQQV